jgi:hypothetical protein
VHHKIKRSQRGNDSLENLVRLCAYCHLAEHGQLFYSVPAVRVCSKPKDVGSEDPARSEFWIRRSGANNKLPWTNS